ncbi:phosphatase, putative [Entamoeba invadens IP1]|uniref:phosphatase, putative n=1 Tax=Entamoeba invadens IP1 TaxID=370355 RepID=UPI0002C3FA27|nr:phosphatase, putative [Entamoeba invadens IP1]ELP93240.1 phosphatase, putative [Entamoeba invadens IP1]|eukprot:XP_004260011.1 phosphatase, putative [Entamoeba invadens IP1]
MLRRLVADDKFMLEVDGTSFDFTYILPNLVAMGYPATGITSQWRNSKEEVAQYLEEHHHNNYMIWNLTEKSYGSLEFQNRVEHVGFLDHHPPRFNHLLKVVGDILLYILDNPNHVACVHCKAGRGRTGLVCSCVLLALGVVSDAKEALEFFAKRRSKIMKGATSPPQIRYCHNFYYYLSVSPREVPFKPIPDYSVVIRTVVVSNFKPLNITKDFSDVAIPVFYFSRLSHSEAKPLLTRTPQNCKEMKEGAFVVSFQNVVLENDTVITIAAETRDKTVVFGKIILHPLFIDTQFVYTFDIDKIMDPTEGVNRNLIGMPRNIQFITTFESDKRITKEVEEFHQKVITVSKVAPLDEMHRSQPPPLPIRKVWKERKVMINSSPRGSRKVQAPPLPPKNPALRKEETLEERDFVRVM